MDVKTGASATRNYYRRIAQNALVDILVVLIAYAAAILIWALDTPLNYIASLWYVIPVTLMLISMSYVFGVYQRIWARTSGHGITVILYATLTATLLAVVIDLLLTPYRFPLRIVLLGNLLSLCGFIGIRYYARLMNSLRWRWKAVVRREFPKLGTRVLIIGAGESGQALAWRLMHRYTSGDAYKVIGFIDDDPDKQKMYVEGCPIVGTRKDIERIADEMGIDLIVVSIHNISGPDFREILSACENTKSMIKVVPDLEALVNTQQHQYATLLRDVQAEDLIGRSTVTRNEAVDLTPVTNKVILITGAAGSIGSELSRQIMPYQPVTVILLDNNESGLHDLLTELRTKYSDVELVPALVDITLRSSLRMIFERHRPQIVFHAAAYKHVPMLEFYPREALRVNLDGTRNIAELARDFSVERFVLISTDKAVNPTSIMGASKRACELMLHALSQQENGHTLFASVRFGNVLGSRGSVVPTFNRQIDNGGPVTVTHQEMTRYFMSIPEAVNLIIHAACLTKGDDIFVLRMGEVVRIVELAERMIRLRGLRPYKDIDILFTGVRPGEKMHEELFLGVEQPIETIHPNILQVNTWSNQFDGRSFYSQLDRLAKETPDFQNNILSKLSQLIQPEESFIHTQNNLHVV